MKVRTILFLLSFAGCATSPPNDFDEKSDAAIRAHSAAFQKCHAEFGGDAPVDVTLKYQLNYSGGVQFVDVDVEGDQRHDSNAELDECLRKVFRQITFPQSAGGLGYGVWSRKQITIGH